MNSSKTSLKYQLCTPDDFFFGCILTYLYRASKISGYGLKCQFFPWASRVQLSLFTLSTHLDLVLHFYLVFCHLALKIAFFGRSSGPWSCNQQCAVCLSSRCWWHLGCGTSFRAQNFIFSYIESVFILKMPFQPRHHQPYLYSLVSSPFLARIMATCALNGRQTSLSLL
jgi:hypothetical protein